MAVSLTTDLRERLSRYDGRATSLLGEAEAAFADRSGYLDALITLSREPTGHIADGATWLLKSALETGRELSQAQTEALCDALEDVHSWPAQLHLCQTVRYWQVSSPGAAVLAAWLVPLLAHERPFLRAWSVDALAHIAAAYPEYERRFRKALTTAEQDEAASVRARAGKLRATL